MKKLSERGILADFIHVKISKIDWVDLFLNPIGRFSLIISSHQTIIFDDDVHFVCLSQQKTPDFVSLLLLPK